VKIGSTRGTSEFDPVQLALHGGEDYELLFTVARSAAGRIPRSFHGLILTPIGEITLERALLLVEAGGRKRTLQVGGWGPFRRAK
jgi:thiamine-monophosphate kinase